MIHKFSTTTAEHCSADRIFSKVRDEFYCFSDGVELFGFISVDRVASNLRGDSTFIVWQAHTINWKMRYLQTQILHTQIINNIVYRILESLKTMDSETKQMWLMGRTERKNNSRRKSTYTHTNTRSHIIANLLSTKFIWMDLIRLCWFVVVFGRYICSCRRDTWETIPYTFCCCDFY